MIAALSPAADNYDETLSTLRYASRVKVWANDFVLLDFENTCICRHAELHDSAKIFNFLLLLQREYQLFVKWLG